MPRTIRILIQTTTPGGPDAWSIDSRTLLRGGGTPGRAVADSSFHHFADFNWDTSRGAPSFVTEPEGTGMTTEPQALADIQRYVRNLAFWLAPARQDGSTTLP